MDYSTQLQSDEWKAKRNEILLRDGYRCSKCHIPRTKFIGLSKQFGIKNINGLTRDG